MALFGQRRSTADDLMESIRRFQAQNPPGRRPTLGELTEASRAMTGRNRPQRPSALDAPRVDGPPVRRPQATATSYTPTVSERIGGMFGRAVGNNELGNSLASLLADWTPIGNVDGVMRDPTLNSLEAQLSVLPIPGPVRRGVGAGVNALTDAVRGPIRAYHGSPHDFDRFSLDRIGTGEGAQAYGRGLYFAENPTVAEGYRFVHARPGVGTTQHWMARQALDEAKYRGIQGDDAFRFARERLNERAQTLQGRRRQEAYDAMNNLEELIQTPPGRMYEVNIHADPGSMLDLDARSQAEGIVRETARDAGVSPYTRYGYEANLNDLLGRPEVTNALVQRGVPGARFLDQGSRSAGDGTRNFVIFDDSLIEIMRKYGLGGLMGAGVAGAAATQGGEPERPIY